MLVSVIIPSFQQAAFLEATLQSVFAQTGVETEIIVIDGGSTDGSVVILERHAGRLAYWESAADRGQSHAFNKGLARATGDAWLLLNSDDLLLPGALSALAQPLADPGVAWSCATAEIWSETDGVLGLITPRHPQDTLDLLCPWRRRNNPIFPFTGACLIRRSLGLKVGPLDETLHYSMDMEYYTRLVLEARELPAIVPATLARWRWHEASKTHQAGRHYAFLADEINIARRYAHHVPPAARRAFATELRVQERWMQVGRAAHRAAQTHAGRWRRTVLLLNELGTNLTLILFRPWWGAFFSAWHPRTTTPLN